MSGNFQLTVYLFTLFSFISSLSKQNARLVQFVFIYIQFIIARRRKHGLDYASKVLFPPPQFCEASYHYARVYSFSDSAVHTIKNAQNSGKRNNVQLIRSRNLIA